VNGLSTVSGRHIAVVPRLTDLLHNGGMDAVAVPGTTFDVDVSGSRMTEVAEVLQRRPRWTVLCSSSVTHVASPDARVET